MKLHPDFSAFIEMLQKHEVQFMIVGSFALALHGRPRATGDIDLWIRPTPVNAKAVVDAIKEFGFGFMNVVEDDILSGKIIQMGVPPVRIDLISVLDGLTAEDAWANREEGHLGQFNVYFIGKQAYIRNKMAVGRHKDLADVESLGASEV